MTERIDEILLDSGEVELSLAVGQTIGEALDAAGGALVREFGYVEDEPCADPGCHGECRTLAHTDPEEA